MPSYVYFVGRAALASFVMAGNAILTEVPPSLDPVQVAGEPTPGVARGFIHNAHMQVTSQVAGIVQVSVVVCLKGAQTRTITIFVAVNGTPVAGQPSNNIQPAGGGVQSVPLQYMGAIAVGDVLSVYLTSSDGADVFAEGVNFHAVVL